MSDTALRPLVNRWLGVGLAASLAVVTIALAVTGRLALYINPESAWFAVGMAVLVLIGTVASFTLPLGGEEDHGHDHGTADAAEHPAEAAHHPRPRRVATAMTATGGVLASGVVVTMLVTPPATLSAELAMSRDVGAAPLFAGTDVVTLAASGDTTQFGVGEWAGIFASATDPDRFDGDPVTLTGFVTPGGDGDFALSRLVITHCVIDAQSASLPVTASTPPPGTGDWVSITGTVRADADGSLRIDADEITPIDEPQDPYEY